MIGVTAKIGEFFAGLIFAVFGAGMKFIAVALAIVVGLAIIIRAVQIFAPKGRNRKDR